MALTFRKEERICSKSLIDTLFGGNRSHSMVAFPLRAVYLETERRAGDPSAQILISVPKRYLKHAVERNRVKRLVREAYRKHKHLLTESLELPDDRKIAIAFVWIDHQVADSVTVETRVVSLLHRIVERKQRHAQNDKT